MSETKTPLIDLLRTVPVDARLVIDDPDGLSTTYIPVGKLCAEAVTALQSPSKQTWVGITDEEYFQYQMKINKPMLSVQDYIDAMKAVEEKLKEKNCEQRQRPLTDEQIDAIISKNVTVTDQNLSGAVYMSMRDLESAHGIWGNK